MALVLSRLGLLVSGGFTVNETAASLSVGKLVGSVVSRHTDAVLFDAFIQQYGVRFTTLPSWLEAVKFDRSGTILGSQLREIPCQNTIFDVRLKSVEGIATFIVLVTRYVESRQQIAKHVEDLIRGNYFIVSGGDLETREKDDPESIAMPYSSRTLIQSFVNAVVDADARSPQHDRCRQLLSELTNVVGSAVFQEQTSRHARSQYQQLLRQMLGRRTALPGKPDNIFNTFSAGAAMIALAALANGAEFRVICQKSSGSVEIPHGGKAFYGDSVFTVVLWLREPPTTLVEELSMIGEGYDMTHDESDPDNLPIFGGVAEISRAVVSQTRCKLPDDLAMEIWELGVQEGMLASWEMGVISGMRIRLTQESLDCELPDHLAHLADGLYGGLYGEGDRRRNLSRKLASILHDVANYSEYASFGDQWFKATIAYVAVSYSVGCLRSIVSKGRELLSQYCWTSDCEMDAEGNVTKMTSERVWALQFSYSIAAPGATIQDFLWRMACVWGGSTTDYHNHVDIHDRVFGIASPHLTFLSDVLRDPQKLARDGLSKGFVSVHAGSLPMLPRDPLSGLVIAADASAHIEGRFAFNRGPKPLPKEPTSGVLFSMEPYTGQEGALCAVICAWQHGEMLLELDPMRVHDNLLAQRSIASYQRNTGIKHSSPNHCFAPLHQAELPVLKSFFMGGLVDGVSIGSRLAAILRAEGQSDWQVVAAGAVQGGEMLMAFAGENLEEILRRDPLKDFSGVLVVVCEHGVLPTGYTNLLDTQRDLASRQSRNELYCIEVDTEKLASVDVEHSGSPWTLRKAAVR